MSGALRLLLLATLLAALASVTAAAPGPHAPTAAPAPRPDERAPPPSGPAAVLPYGLTPGAMPSSVFAVTVDGGRGAVDVPVEHVPGAMAHARWVMRGSVAVRVTARVPLGTHRLSPLSAGLDEETSGDAITFVLDRPRKLVLHGIPGTEEQLVLAAQPPEADTPVPDGAAVRDAVTDGGADPTGAADTQPAIQAVLLAPGTETVVVPRGRYRLAGPGPLVVPEDRRLHLSPEAVLVADPDVPDRLGGALVQPEARARITGRGILDGEGIAIRPRMTRDWVMVETPDVGAPGVVIRDVTIRNGPKGSLSLKGAPGFRVTGVTLITGLDAIGAANGDGVAVQDGSDGGVVDDALIIGSDDPVAVGYRSPTRDVVVGNLLAGNLRSGAVLKGVFHEDHPDDGVNRDFTLENVDVIGTPRIVSYIPQHPGTFADQYVKGVRTEDFAGEASGGLAIQLDLERWDPASTGAARIEGFVVSGLSVPAAPPTRSIIRGADAGHVVSDVRVEDLRAGGDALVTPEAAGMEIGPFATGVVLDGTRRPELSVDAVAPVLAPGEPARFRIARTGDTSAPLTVPYALAGWGAGEHEVTIPPGAEEVEIAAPPGGGIRHALVTLRSTGPNLDAIVGPRYLALAALPD